MKKKEETTLKKACTQLLKDNGGFSLPIPGGHFGVNGAPDRICFYQGRAVCIEFKTEGKGLSLSQQEMRAKILLCGCEYHVIYNQAEFIAAMGLATKRLF